MITLLKRWSMSLLFLTAASTAFAQDATKPEKEFNKVYGGLGFGLDYGGFGAKIEYLPIEEIGVFAGVGYNLEEAGWNVGVSYKLKVSKRVSLNPLVMYGYNAVLQVDGASEYNMVSYGTTFGANVDIYVGNRGDKISAGLYVPIRSKKFMDNYDEVKDSSYIEMKNELWPIAIGVGYNWKLN
ncbi:hypothetical protein [Myroides sp. DW712]|uniref:hypothetical protein n=1 Tax=Myroides sp. DW712 TaxID=3389800 RepID=UPI00397A39EB